MCSSTGMGVWENVNIEVSSLNPRNIYFLSFYHLSLSGSRTDNDKPPHHYRLSTTRCDSGLSAVIGGSDPAMIIKFGVVCEKGCSNNLYVVRIQPFLKTSPNSIHASLKLLWKSHRINQIKSISSHSKCHYFHLINHIDYRVRSLGTMRTHTTSMVIAAGTIKLCVLRLGGRVN